MVWKWWLWSTCREPVAFRSVQGIKDVCICYFLSLSFLSLCLCLCLCLCLSLSYPSLCVISVSLCVSLPWYNRTGWLGVKHQFTYSLCLSVSLSLFLSLCLHLSVCLGLSVCLFLFLSHFLSPSPSIFLYSTPSLSLNDNFVSSFSFFLISLLSVLRHVCLSSHFFLSLVFIPFVFPFSMLNSFYVACLYSLFYANSVSSPYVNIKLFSMQVYSKHS